MMRSSVSERELAEDICQRKDFYETLLKAQSDVGEGLLVVKDGRIRYANEAFCLISGYSASELTALPIFGELAVPDQRCLLEDRMRRGLHGETVENHYEAAILHRSGRRVDVDVAVGPVSEDNPFPHLVAIVRDITERKRLEEKLKSSLEALVAVHEAGRALSSTLEQKEIGSRLLRIMLRICDLNAAVINLQDEDRRWDVLAAAGPESLWRAANATAEAQACPPEGTGEQRARNILAGTSGRGWHAFGGIVPATGDPRPSHWRAGSVRPRGSGREGDCRDLRKPSQTGGECTGERPAVSEGGRARAIGSRIWWASCWWLERKNDAG